MRSDRVKGRKKSQHSPALKGEEEACRLQKRGVPIDGRRPEDEASLRYKGSGPVREGAFTAYGSFQFSQKLYVCGGWKFASGELWDIASLLSFTYSGRCT